MTGPTLDYDDPASVAGRDIGLSDWLHLDQTRINRFADATVTISGSMLTSTAQSVNRAALLLTAF